MSDEKQPVDYRELSIGACLGADKEVLPIHVQIGGILRMAEAMEIISGKYTKQMNQVDHYRDLYYKAKEKEGEQRRQIYELNGIIERQKETIAALQQSLISNSVTV